MKFRLRSAHYFTGDKWLPGDKEMEHLGEERGTIVGDGTPHPIEHPTIEMIPLDEEAEEALAAEMDRLARIQAAPSPVDALPMTMQDSFEKNYVPGFPGVKRPRASA